jgi:hypothetical protein
VNKMTDPANCGRCDTDCVLSCLLGICI